MTATMDKLTATMTAQEDMFKLSPLPSTLHCPTELPPDSDAENDEPLKKTSGLSEAYSRQSIPAISIKPTDTPSSGSLLSSRIRDHDIAMASSLPRAGECDSIHSFMGKRQSSPPRASSSMLQSGPPDPFDINGDVIMGSASLPRHSFMRESKPSSLDPCADEQGNYDRWRRELRDLLHDDHVPPLSRRGSYTRPSSPPRFIGDSTSRLFVSRARIDGNSQFLPIRGGRERSNSDERAPPTSSFQFTVSHPPSPPPVPVGPTSPVSPTSTTVSPTSPPSAQLIPRPSLISRASSAAREAETRARAAAGERHRRESGGSTTSLSSIASSSSGRPSSALREQPSEALSRRGSLANNKPRSHAIGVQALS
ncbi:hypothetical protein NEOLEDRAFT_294637 [Neolentinus lepideus HHB14362 ss-1]|uniref:Uncharacterized protein n=1 Tax=Neolentinus lepideus HHB14362 ss-1 TaxID=1314782 RepID=A0A165T115_9AGAM|nr:hypothetical protein NEOLEDRAFT_294637 [Neolentinus lepideus HHB14362 ss-1]